MSRRWSLPGAALALTLAAAAALWGWGRGVEPQRPLGAGAGRFLLTAPLREALAARPALWGPVLRPAQLEGRVVLVTFFASWCVPCQAELQALERLNADPAARDVSVLAINHFESFDGLSDPRRLARFLARTAPSFPVIAGSDGLAQTFGGVQRIPTLLLFDRAGRHVGTFFNRAADGAVLDYPHLRQLVASLR